MSADNATHEYFGHEPIVDVMLDWCRGLIGENVAIQLSSEPQITQALNVEKLARLSGQCVRWGYQGHWQEAAKLHRLLVNIFLVHSDRFVVCLPELAAEHLRVATQALWYEADDGVYSRAVSFGQYAWTAVASERQKSVIAHEMGILHLDPYIGSRELNDFNRWWRRLEATRTEVTSALEMPEPREALAEAKMWLERAIEDTGTEKIERLQTLKALMQTACSLPMFGVPIDQPYVRELLAKTVPLLPFARDRPDIVSYLERVSRAVDQPLTAALDEDPLQVDWDDRITNVGIELVTDTLLSALRARVDANIPEAIKLAQRVERIFEKHADEEVRVAFYKVLAKALLGEPVKPPWLDRVRQRTIRRIAEGAHNETRGLEISKVLGWIHQRVSEDREEEAADWLLELCQAAPDFYQKWAGAIGFFRAGLIVGAAVNKVNTAKPDEAIMYYYDAWVFFLREGYYKLALDLMGRIADQLPHGTADTANAICELVREQRSPWIEEIIDDWHRACARLSEAAMHPMLRTPTAGGWFAVARLAKGPAFANQFLTTERYDWNQDAEAVQMVAEIERLQALSEDEPRRMEAEDLFEHALVSYHSVPTTGGGKTPGEQRDKLARCLDLHVRRKLAELSSQATERFTVDQVQAKLPDDVVVLDMLFPQQAQVYGYCLAITSETVRMFMIALSNQVFHGAAIEGDTGEFWSSHSGMAVARVRRAVQEDSPPGCAMSKAAGDALQDVYRLFLGDGIEWLDEQRATGKCHLVVVPDGASHFLPFHLLGFDGAALADTWTVTYLPSMDLLRRPARDSPARTTAEVFGLGYMGASAQPGVIPLEGALDEAAAVAIALGTRPIPEHEATPARVLQAMAGAKYVHVACHGDHDVVASSLQSLKLYPAPGQDGRLRNLDVLGLDGNGLSMLALSACETALGRLDLGGNLLGISASALSSGAACVIGTLWPAADDASALFFSTMFAKLGANESRRDAFRHAQVETRKYFPEYRDWGAFYLVGHW